MAAKSNLLNMTLVLFGTCLVCSAVLGLVNEVTREPIAAAAAAEAKAAIAEVLPEGGEISEAKTTEIDGVNYEYYEEYGGGQTVGYAVKSSTAGFGGTLSLMVGVLPDGTIFNTKVLSHSETPGLGAKCTSDKKFMDQWYGFSKDGNLAVRKDGGDVDAITASTITSRAYTLAVAQARKLVKTLDPDATTGASVIKNKEN